MRYFLAIETTRRRFAAERLRFAVSYSAWSFSSAPTRVRSDRANGVVPPQWEMYDLLKDPTEIDNLAAPGRQRTKEQQAEYVRLQAKLRVVQATRLQPLT